MLQRFSYGSHISRQIVRSLMWLILAVGESYYYLICYSCFSIFFNILETPHSTAQTQTFALSPIFLTTSRYWICVLLDFMCYRSSQIVQIDLWVWLSGAHLGGGGIHPLPSKWKVSLNRPCALKISYKGLKWPKMPCLKIHIPCPYPRCTTGCYFLYFFAQCW